MTLITRQETSRYSPLQLYRLIADVPDYPEFLPWCRASRIISRESDTEFHAELVIAFKNFTESYTSRVMLYPPESEYSPCRIQAQMIEGPFHHLSTLWQLEPNPEGGTQIHLDLDFQFRNMLLDKLIGGLYGNASEKMISAFRQRARDLYGEPTAASAD